MVKHADYETVVAGDNGSSSDVLAYLFISLFIYFFYIFVWLWRKIVTYL